MSASLQALSFEHARLAEALLELARRAGLAPAETRAPEPADATEGTHEAREAWIEAALRALGVEGLRERVAAEELGSALEELGPALLELAEEPARWLCVLRRRGARLVLLVPHGEGVREHALGIEALHELLREHLASHAGLRGGTGGASAAELDELCAQAGLAGRRRARARAAVLDARLAGLELAPWWRLARPAGRAPRAHAADLRLGPRLAGIGALHLAAHVLFVGSWIALGRGALLGRLDPAWLAAWALALAGLVPLRLAQAWAQERLALDGGLLLRRWLLRGALRHEPDELRHLGAGSLLSRVLESEALQGLLLLTLFAGLAAAVELPIAALALQACKNPFLPWLFAVWIALALALGARHALASRAWTRARLDLTHALVERMVGHKTRLVQEAPERRHEGEDLELAGYLRRSREQDRGLVLLQGLVAPGWLALGVLALVPSALERGLGLGLALEVGALLLAQRALARLGGALAAAAPLAATWRELAATVRAASRPDVPGRAELAAEPRAAPGVEILRASGLAQRHEGRSQPTFEGLELVVRAGERLRLEGTSGAGKSTLVAVLAGLRSASEGLVTLRGLDLAAWGADGWRRRVAAAPQLHENHVFPGTLAFNLLLGRRWPPEAEDLEEARALCLELGLGPLLERMPAGLDQVVGETGWQLSHGERSRVFLARALLQGAELTILDESLAALDAESLIRSLSCVERRARAALLVAHA